MTDYDKPSEMTYRDYREHVETAAETAVEEYGLEHDGEIYEAIEYAVDGSQLVNNYGYMLMTVLLSDKNPDQPDYCSPWDLYVDFSNEPSWSDAVSAMAYVCYYSDVMEKAKWMLEDDDE